jgi:hypothetical protein
MSKLDFYTQFVIILTFMAYLEHLLEVTEH